MIIRLAPSFSVDVDIAEGRLTALLPRWRSRTLPNPRGLFGCPGPALPFGRVAETLGERRA